MSRRMSWGFLKRNAAGGEPGFHGFFPRLLAVVDGRVQRAVRRVGGDARGLQVVPRLGQPLARETGKGFIHRVCGPGAKSGAGWMRANDCNGQTQRASARRRLCSCPNRRGNDAPAASAESPSRRSPAQSPSSPRHYPHEASPRRASRIKKSVPVETRFSTVPPHFPTSRAGLSSRLKITTAVAALEVRRCGGDKVRCHPSASQP